MSVLNATDATSGLVLSVVVEAKGSNPYDVAELRRFILECGRAGGVLQPLLTPAQIQSGQENPMKSLVRDVAALSGMAVRNSPVYVSQAQGRQETRQIALTFPFLEKPTL